MSRRASQVAIRLALQGCTNRPFYHLVVMHKHKGRNGRVIEQIGSYDPMPNIHDEKLVGINYDRLKYWCSSGAEVTKPVAKLLGLNGFFPIHPMTYIAAKRNRAAADKSEQTTPSGEDQNSTASGS